MTAAMRHHGPLKTMARKVASNRPFSIAAFASVLSTAVLSLFPIGLNALACLYLLQMCLWYRSCTKTYAKNELVKVWLDGRYCRGKVVRVHRPNRAQKESGCTYDIQLIAKKITKLGFTSNEIKALGKSKNVFSVIHEEWLSVCNRLGGNMSVWFSMSLLILTVGAFVPVACCMLSMPTAIGNFGSTLSALLLTFLCIFAEALLGFGSAFFHLVVLDPISSGTHSDAGWTCGVPLRYILWGLKIVWVGAIFVSTTKGDYWHYGVLPLAPVAYLTVGSYIVDKYQSRDMRWVFDIASLVRRYFLQNPMQFVCKHVCVPLVKNIYYGATTGTAFRNKSTEPLLQHIADLTSFVLGVLNFFERICDEATRYSFDSGDSIERVEFHTMFIAATFAQCCFNVYCLLTGSLLPMLLVNFSLLCALWAGANHAVVDSSRIKTRFHQYARGDSQREIHSTISLCIATHIFSLVGVYVNLAILMFWVLLALTLLSLACDGLRKFKIYCQTFRPWTISSQPVAVMQVSAPAPAQGKNAEGLYECVVCSGNMYESEGILCNEKHFVCRECTEHYAQDQNPSERPDFERCAAQKREDGRLYCPAHMHGQCTAPAYDHKILAKCLPQSVYLRCLDVERQMKMKSEVDDLHAKYAKMLQKLRVENSSTGEMTTMENQMLVEQLRRLSPNARMCGNCGFGPVDHAYCYDLETHHGDGMIDNGCPKCHWFRSDINEWPMWDGTLSFEIHSEGGTGTTDDANPSSVPLHDNFNLDRGHGMMACATILSIVSVMMYQGDISPLWNTTYTLCSWFFFALQFLFSWVWTIMSCTVSFLWEYTTLVTLFLVVVPLIMTLLVSARERRVERK